MTGTLQSQLSSIKSDAERGIGASSGTTLCMVDRIETMIELIDDLNAKVGRPKRVNLDALIRNFSVPRYTLLYLVALFAVDLAVSGATGSTPITIVAVIAAACVLHNPFAKTSLLTEANTELAHERLQADNQHLTITRSEP